MCIQLVYRKIHTKIASLYNYNILVNRGLLSELLLSTLFTTFLTRNSTLTFMGRKNIFSNGAIEALFSKLC